VDDERRRTAADRQEVFFVLNFFTLETEVAHRRVEFERVVAAAAQSAQVPPKNKSRRWSHIALMAFAHLRSLASPQVRVPSWNPAGVKCANTLEGGRATAT